MFLQYEGVAPRNIVRLFNMVLQRKDQTRNVIERHRHNDEPVYRPAMDGFATREQIVVAEVQRKEMTKKTGSAT